MRKVFLIFLMVLINNAVSAQKKASDVITPDVIEFFDLISLKKAFFKSDAHLFEEKWKDEFYDKTKVYFEKFKTQEEFNSWIKDNLVTTSFNNLNDAENFFRRVLAQQELNRKTYKDLSERESKIFEKLGEGAMELFSEETAKSFFTGSKFKVVN